MTWQTLDEAGTVLAWDESDASERIYRVRVERRIVTETDERGEHAWYEAGDVEWIDAPEAEDDREAIVAAVVRSWDHREARHDLTVEREDARYPGA